MTDKQKPEQEDGSPLDGLLNKGRSLVAGLQGQAEDTVKQELDRAAEAARGAAQQVLGSAKVIAGETLGQTGLVEQGRADEAAGQARRKASGAAEPLQQAGDSVVEQARGSLSGLAASLKGKFSGGDDKDDKK
jgi:uncharacterized protein YjbJ (UPF0337 family)